MFEQTLNGDYKKLPLYTTSFFPLAYQCYGKPFPPEQDKKIRALMPQADDGYLDDHVASTFHLVHYYRLMGAATPKADAIVARMLRDQKAGRQLDAQSAGPRSPRHVRRDVLPGAARQG